MLKKFFFLNLLLNCLCQNIESTYEKIYAAMITGKDNFHKFLAEKSIKSFLEQTYPNKHLIIINDGNYSFDHLDKKLVTEVKLKEKNVLGKLRNISLSLIPEDCIYLQWDDDDWHHPNLMLEQYLEFKKKSADMCLLHSQVQYSFKTNSAVEKYQKKGIWGTIMCRKKNNIKYQEVIKGEDANFVNFYCKNYKCVAWKNPPYYYLRFVHGHNTWHNNHFLDITKVSNQWKISITSKSYLSKILPLYNFIKK